MADVTWKRCEREVARRLAGTRTGNRGAATPDVVNRWLSCEVKSRAELPHWLQAAMRQAVANAWPETLPVVILHQAGQRHDDDMVCLRLRDFEAWFGDLSGGGEVATDGNERHP